MEEEAIVIGEMGADFPILFVPRHLTTLEMNCAATDNVFINLNITSEDTEGNEMNVYSGFCNVKVIDSYNVNNNDGGMDFLSDSDNVLGEITLQDSNDTIETEMLRDPTYNPYVSDAMEAHESAIYQSDRERITVRRHSSYIKKNINEYSESVQYSQLMEFEHKKFKRVKKDNEIKQHVNPGSNEHLECELYLSQLPEEIIIDNEKRAKEEMKYIDLASDNDAIKQLMSSQVQAMPRQKRTIAFLGESLHEGQTVQTIAINDPQAKCLESRAGSDIAVNNPGQKKYQCEKCKQMFYQISAFRQHIKVKHRPKNRTENPNDPDRDVAFMCLECKKNFKIREKFEIHCLGHGNPEVECSMCHKVFASKLTLQNHTKIHMRKHKCPNCTKSYQKFEDLIAHLEKIHFVSKCDTCNFISSTLGLQKHREEHKFDEVQEPQVGPDGSEAILSLAEWPGSAGYYSLPYEESRQDHNSVIAQAMSNEAFLRHTMKGKKCKTKRCNICLKTFDRLSDLKRHLIEHILRSSLAKNPIDDSGILCLTCEVCHSQTFSRIDEYKAHLREHAKLTTYKCTFCAKTFSDSSNFSKHKKVHGNTHFQCDMCLRKFNSKKSLTLHIEHHNTHAPINCYYCNREFHYRSTLNKHIKFAHQGKVTRYKCTICDDILNTVKEKLDHEWMVHQVRKIVVDCRLCGAKFRKYSELKRHCKSFHVVEIPPASRLLRKRKARK